MEGEIRYGKREDERKAKRDNEGRERDEKGLERDETMIKYKK